MKKGRTAIGDRGLGIRDWGLGIGDWMAELWRRFSGWLRQYGSVKRIAFLALLVLSCLFFIALSAVLHSPVLASFRSHSPTHSSTPPHLHAVAPASAASQAKDPFNLYDQGKYEAARDLWQKAADQAARSSNLLEELPNRLNEVLALKALGAYKRAEDVLKDVLDKTVSPAMESQRDKDQILQYRGQLLRSLGDVYQATGKSNEAHGALTCSLSIATSPQEIGDAYFSLGMAERAEIIRNIPRILVINPEGKQSAISGAVTFLGTLPKQPLGALQSTPKPSLDNSCLQPTAQLLKNLQNSERQKANVGKALEYFHQALEYFRLQPLPDSNSTTKATLNQVSLLVNLLPQLNTFIATTLSLSDGLVANNATYFLTSYLPDSPLKRQLKPLVHLVRDLDVDGTQKLTQPTAIEDLLVLKQQTADLTDELLGLLDQSSKSLNNLPLKPDTIAIHINYAQNLLRLKQVLDTAEGVAPPNQPDERIDGVNYQLRLKLEQILKPIETAYNNSAKALKPADRVKIKAVFEELKKKELRQLSLFLSDTTLKSLKNTVTGSLKEAERVLVKAIDIAAAQTIGNRRAEAAARVALANVYSVSAENSDTGFWPKVEKLAGQALLLVQQKKDGADDVPEEAPDIVFRAQRLYARSLIKQTGKTPAARAACRIAATTLQANRSNLVAVDQDVQYTFRDSVEPFYRECATVLLPTNEENNPQKLQEKNVQENLEAARNFIDSLQLAELDNFFRNACLEGRKVNLDTLIDQQYPTTAVIYPFLLSSKGQSGKSIKDQVAVIAKIPGQKTLEYKLFPSGNEKRYDVEAFLRNLKEQLSKDQNIPKTQQESREVYKWLVQSFEEKFGNQVSTLVFVPDTAFRGIPIAALHDGEKYLAQGKYAIAISPSLQLLESKTISRDRLNILAAGVADPPEALKNKLPDPYNRQFGRLRPVQEEIYLLDAKSSVLPADLKSVATLVGARGTAQILPQEKFTVKDLQTTVSASPFNIVHLSTHGIFSSRKDLTFILGYEAPIFVEQFSDIFQDRLKNGLNPIELLVLSACQTATGDDRAALGLAGIALKSGVRSTLATLWSADKDGTVEFMKAFYAELQQGKTKAEAVKMAQQKLLENPNADFRKPSVWAPYTLVGNWM